MEKIYDLVILGAGPAGLSAGIYGGRSRLSTLIIEQGKDGGQIAITSSIENYPGQMLTGETGATLIARMTEQARLFGAERRSDTIKELSLREPVKRLIGNHDEYLAKSVIVATGAQHRPIGCINEEKFIGKGISFCATCDALFFEQMEVYVVGGGDAAVEEAVYLAKFARSVTIIHRRNELRAAQSIQDKAFATPNIHFMWESIVVEVGGDELLSTIIVKNVKTGELTTLHADLSDGFFGLFGFLGLLPNTELLAGSLDLDAKGYVKTDENMHTNIPGVFAAGDLRTKVLRQVVTAAADGAIAANEAQHYLVDL